MILRMLIVALCISSIFAMSLQGQEKQPFYPGIFWSNDAEKGAIVISANEIFIMGSSGEKYGKIITRKQAYDVYISPDGKKVAYATSKGLWLADIKTKENYLVREGECSDFHWNKDSLSFIFVISLKNNDISVVKLFWADGDGKNIKQIYP